MATALAYYNEIDPFAAQWLRNLVAANLIAPGDVDERSIRDVQATDLRGFRQCHFFAGIGVWSHALRLAGWPDDREIWTGSCPCQPFSVAGSQLGTADERHLWPEFFRLIRECRPAIIIGEQVAGPAALAWLDLVSADLEGEGYAVGAADLCAASVGAPHIRQRLYWVADASGRRNVGQRPDGLLPKRIDDGEAMRVAHNERERLQGGEHTNGREGTAGGGRRLADEGAAGLRLGHARRSRSRRDAGAVLGPQGEGAGERRGARGVADESVAASAARGMADHAPSGRRQERANARGLAAGDIPQGRAAGLGAGEPACGLADADGGQPGDRELQRSGRHLQQPENPLAGFWTDAVWLPCTDGKARPVEPGIEPLAHGVAGRVGRLRAYGNALCAPVAQAFVKTVMEYCW
jgi:DNA (cytosine-5)-methyltransferase 1